MKIQGQHLVFYDGTCGMCHRAVQFLLKHDKHRLFMFAPLQGETAAQLLTTWRAKHPDIDSLVLMENFHNSEKRQIFALGKGALRICWLLGGLWTIPGSFSFFPSCLYDWGYRWIARHRFQWFARQSCLIPKTEDTDRFLA